VDKTYHVQVDCLADGGLLQRVRQGVTADGDRLAVKQASLLRHGEKNSWLEIVLDEGKNRHLRRLLAALGVNVLRLMRVAIGPLRLGTLAKGESRELSRAEVLALAKPSLPDAGR
jgi:23S rRNA pseudouridine2605 synthase